MTETIGHDDWRLRDAAIPREPIKSSNMRSVGYDDATQTLVVEFSSGSVYSYRPLERTLYEELLAAESAGRYFAQHIRKSHEGNLVIDGAIAYPHGA